MASNKTAKDSITSRATTHLRRLARNRNTGVVTADDVQAFLDRQNFIGSQNSRLSVTRSVLREPNFAPLFPVRSSRPSARGRVIMAWMAR